MISKTLVTKFRLGRIGWSAQRGNVSGTWWVGAHQAGAGGIASPNDILADDMVILGL